MSLTRFLCFATLAVLLLSSAVTASDTVTDSELDSELDRVADTLLNAADSAPAPLLVLPAPMLLKQSWIVLKKQ